MIAALNSLRNLATHVRVFLDSIDPDELELPPSADQAYADAERLAAQLEDGIRAMEAEVYE